MVNVTWITHASYLTVFLLLLAAGFGIPIPEDLPLLGAGYLCHLGKADLRIMLPLTFVGVLSCDLILFAMGRRFGDHVLEHRLTARLFHHTTLDAVKRKFHQHGAKIIFAGRFMPGARAVIFVSAGIVRVPWWKFVVVNGSAALISVPTLVIIGKVAGDKLEEVLEKVRYAEHWVAASLLVFAVVAVLVSRYVSRRRARAEPAAPDSETPPATTPASDADRRVPERQTV